MNQTEADQTEAIGWRDAGQAVEDASTPLSKKRLKLWIRLLALTRGTERQLREYLRIEHNTTLPRFDVMAALWRRPEGLTMTEISRRLLVSGGNTTVVVNGLEKEGLVKRKPYPRDSRIVYVALTEKGLAEFEHIAAGHEAELDKLLDAFTEAEIDTLAEVLKSAGGSASAE